MDALTEDGAAGTPPCADGGAPPGAATGHKAAVEEEEGAPPPTRHPLLLLHTVKAPCNPMFTLFQSPQHWWCNERYLLWQYPISASLQ